MIEDNELYEILQTSVIGGAYEACGVGFDVEQGLEVYHISEFSENVDPDDVTGSYTSPDHFLEDLCGVFSGDIYKAIDLMESSWKLGTPTMHKDWQRRVCRKLWDLGKDRCVHYLSENGEEDELSHFLTKGESLFGNGV